NVRAAVLVSQPRKGVIGAAAANGHSRLGVTDWIELFPRQESNQTGFRLTQKVGVCALVFRRRSQELFLQNSQVSPLGFDVFQQIGTRLSLTEHAQRANSYQQ